MLRAVRSGRFARPYRFVAAGADIFAEAERDRVQPPGKKPGGDRGKR